MVRGNVYGYQRAGAAVLQLAVCGIRAIQPTEGTTRTAEAQRGQWKEQLGQGGRASRSRKRGKRIWLVCGTTSMYTGLDGLMAIGGII